MIAAIDADELAMATYRLNHPRTRHYLADVREIDPRLLAKHLKLKKGDLELLAGCPPCQGFSTLRTLNGARGTDSQTNNLVLQLVRFAEVLLPKAIMIENVPGLLQDKRFRRITSKLANLGYQWNAGVFNAAEYGVPQRRRRAILIASRGAKPSFAPPDEKRSTVRDAIGSLPSPKKSKDPAHNYEVAHAAHVKKIIASIPKDGGSRKSRGARAQLPCHKRSDGFSDIYGRMAWTKTAPTITSGCINPSKGRFIHPDADRAITLREAALLQGFPAGYKIDLSRGRYPAAEMIGNAFPPVFAEKHARQLRLKLKEIASS